MMDNNQDVQELCLKDIFSDKCQYSIPIYQRNYAWGEREITQLIQDIKDYSAKTDNYYIGSLVVYESQSVPKPIFDTIDGQQRLTTLTIMLCVLKHEFDLGDFSWFNLNLTFESRKNSSQTLKAIFDKNRQDVEGYNTSITQAYQDVKKELKKMRNDEISNFYEYLCKNVIILRVPVPGDTDLNHYFEIMNNRGEQLEKHEVLKAKCLEKIKDDKLATYTFSTIWEACSNMEKYVQYGFNINQRHSLFGQNDWSTFQCNNFDDVVIKMAGESNDATNSPEGQTLHDILSSNLNRSTNTDKNHDDSPERFNTIINFSNFLLHVLRVQTKTDISLDDKQLLSIFENHLKNGGITFVKNFAFSLLKMKFFFDKFVIKREFIKGTDNWSLKRLKWNDKNKGSYVNTFGQEEEDTSENKNILMLLAMFHVSTPTLVYKHWLNACLKYVFEHQEIDNTSYKMHLENLAKAFLYDRFMSNNQRDYFEIIYTNEGIAQNNASDLDENILNKGTDVENFVFNYLDYLLWKDGKYNDFKFTFRSSVEHYYPQNPIEGNQRLDQAILDNFGNLCLISRNKNAKLSNYMPLAKKDHYKNVTIDSIKQSIMMEEDAWTEDEIIKHSEIMIEYLKKGIM
jgi:hypothetical protein